MIAQKVQIGRIQPLNYASRNYQSDPANLQKKEQNITAQTLTMFSRLRKSIHEPTIVCAEIAQSYTINKRNGAQQVYSIQHFSWKVPLEYTAPINAPLPPYALQSIKLTSTQQQDIANNQRLLARNRIEFAI